MEHSGLEPEILTCKASVLPKLHQCPNTVSPLGIEPSFIIFQISHVTRPCQELISLRRLDSNQQDLSEDALTVRCSSNYAYCGIELRGCGRIRTYTGLFVCGSFTDFGAQPMLSTPKIHRVRIFGLEPKPRASRAPMLPDYTIL